MFNKFSKKKNSIRIKVSVLVEKDGGVFYAYSPMMPGLHVEGDTQEEVEKNVEEAVVAYLASLIKHNDPLPIAFPIFEKPNAKAYTFTQNIPAYA